MSDAPRGHWIAGRLVEPASARRRFAWSWALGVPTLIVLLDLVLAMLPAPASTPAQTSAELRAAIRAAADAPGRSILIVGDRQLELASLREHVDVDTPIALHAIDLPELTPADALALVRELDRADPDASVELALTIDLRDFGEPLAESGCSRPATCELRDEPSSQVHDWLLEHTPVLRHRARLGLVRTSVEPPVRRSTLAASLPGTEHAQVAALVELLELLRARDRRAALILPPLAEVDEADAGRLQAELARTIHDRGEVELIDLDHPLFVPEHFEQGRLGREGRELLALNLLYELAVPLDRRPFEWQMVHPEGHDRTLVHRVDAGFGEAGAARTRFAAPEGVAASPDGRRIVVADTGNHMLRQLRGNLQTVERLAGDPDHEGVVDGPALAVARLAAPRRPLIEGERVVFIDGFQGELVRMVEDGYVDTLDWQGPRCHDMRSLRAARGALLILCGNGSVLRLDRGEGRATRLTRAGREHYVALEANDERVWLADEHARIWERSFRDDGTLGLPRLVFANEARTIEGDASDLLPHGHHVGFPYRFDAIGLAEVVDMRWVDRYQALLVMDEHPVDPAVQPAPTERVQLRLLHFESKQVYPWIKPLAHGEAFTLWNEQAELNASWYHVGSMALVERDASLVWLEHDRSRLLRIADGLLGVAQTANHHTRGVSIPHMTTLSGTVARRAGEFRPDRFLDRRWEPLPRSGPYVFLLLGSSLSSMSDRFANYSLARLIERELQRELGYRDLIRIDLYPISSGAAMFSDNLRNLENWLLTSVPPDVVMIEAHDFAGNWLRKVPEPAQVAALFAKLEALADRYDTLVIFYDNSQTEANRRDGLRSTDPNVVEVLEQARALGFTVVRPGDLLLERLALESPWGNQPYANNQHHGSTWGLERSAELIAAMSYPVLREFLRGRTPARLLERDPASFETVERGEPLRTALDGLEIDRKRLPKVALTHLRREYDSGLLRVHVDLAGYPKLARDSAQLERLGIAVALTVLDDDVYAELARELEIEIVEFSNYDEYGEGVLDSANSLWTRRFDRAALKTFLSERAPKSR
ncbi:hypothetical protein ACNOYE_04500 [Nannocystaceae bacterium ST9]